MIRMTAPLQKLTAFEEAARQSGYRVIAGVDEAGRGPLAGPVVAAACILPKGLIIDGIDDSKKLSAAQRDSHFETLTQNPDIFYGIAVVDAQVIDQINILQATFKAMLIAIDALPQKPDYVFVDGPFLPSASITGKAVVEGDSLVQSISCASVLAKVTRDRLMREYDVKWPMYGFAKHKGYGTSEHLSAIKEHGPCPIHRMSFSPFRQPELF